MSGVGSSAGSYCVVKLPRGVIVLPSSYLRVFSVVLEFETKRVLLFHAFYNFVAFVNSDLIHYIWRVILVLRLCVLFFLASDFELRVVPACCT